MSARANVLVNFLPPQSYILSNTRTPPPLNRSSFSSSFSLPGPPQKSQGLRYPSFPHLPDIQVYQRVGPSGAAQCQFQGEELQKSVRKSHETQVQRTTIQFALLLCNLTWLFFNAFPFPLFPSRCRFQQALHEIDAMKGVAVLVSSVKSLRKAACLSLFKPAFDKLTSSSHEMYFQGVLTICFCKILDSKTISMNEFTAFYIPKVTLTDSVNNATSNSSPCNSGPPPGIKE